MDFSSLIKQDSIGGGGGLVKRILPVASTMVSCCSWGNISLVLGIMILADIQWWNVRPEFEKMEVKSSRAEKGWESAGVGPAVVV